MKEIFTTYCVRNKEEKNIVCRTDEKNCQEYKEWKDRCIKRLRVSYNIVHGEFLDGFEYNKKGKLKKIYFDPDGAFKKNHQFFDDLIAFLNEREQALKKKLRKKETFIYEFAESNGIKVSQITKRREKQFLFYLRSDQLGFSYPHFEENEKWHPYDLFIKLSLKQSKDKADDAINQVVKWLAESRTLGGSFLWPCSFYKNYNRDRGGKITSNRRFYMQDRVDLTLLDIKNQYKVYEGLRSNNTVMNRNDTSDLKVWLGHFKDFKTYVEFFFFDPFIKNDWPIDIFSEKNTLCFNEFEKRKPKITKDIDLSELKKILEKVNACIKERTMSMSKCINE